MAGPRWTLEQDDIIRRMAGCRVAAVMAALAGVRQHLSYDSVRIRMRTLAVRRSAQGGPNHRAKTMPSTMKRKCLCCGETFDSFGPGNRMCDDCKRGPSAVAV